MSDRMARSLAPVLLAFVLPLLLLMSACGGGTNTVTPSPSPTSGSAPMPTSAANASPTAGPQATGSPAGSVSLGKVAYVLDGDIYTVDLPSSLPQRLTTDGTNASPRWSPSGDWLIFRRLNSYWVMRADGSDARVLQEGYAVWAARDDRLAYTSGPGTVVVANADGSGRLELPAPPGTPAGLAWSPDGSWLAFVEESDLPDRYAKLWLLPSDGSGANVERFSSTTDGIFLAGWTADARFVLYWRDTLFSASLAADGLPLEAVRISGAQPRQLAVTLTAPGLLAPLGSGEDIAITDGPGRETWTGKRIAVVNAQAGQSTDLSPADSASIAPAWSPNGSQIAFVSEPDKGAATASSDQSQLAADRRIWVMGWDGSDQRQLTSDETYRDERPLWSADGSQVLFARLDAALNASLWLVASGGGTPRRVVDVVGAQAAGVQDHLGLVSWYAIYDYWAGPPQ
jgi:Tol biopolymer transport system component